jgi:hypothetical protein
VACGGVQNFELGKFVKIHQKSRMDKTKQREKRKRGGREVSD